MDLKRGRQSRAELETDNAMDTISYPNIVARAELVFSNAPTCRPHARHIWSHSPGPFGIRTSRAAEAQEGTGWCAGSCLARGGGGAGRRLCTPVRGVSTANRDARCYTLCIWTDCRRVQVSTEDLEEWLPEITHQKSQAFGTRG